ncbi:MAG: UDP-glucose 4-epimerase GalE [Magnetococcales bacterium]|nr:UDP-glucose 4-epimerase GalE [Magnetococcales bacterium]
MRILVAGGAGYIGSHTCKTLAQAGHEPVVYDNLSLGHAESVKWGPLVVGDLADQALLEATLREFQIEAVVHFAAKSCVGESMQEPMPYFINNSVGTTRLLDAMLRCGVSRIVFSSTCAVYGVPDFVPIEETCPTRPINPYGETKLAIEKMLHWLGVLHGLRWISLRYFNAAGADPAGELGEEHDPETHLIPLVLRAAAPGTARLQVFGTDYPTPDGTAIRDYIHVTDLADAHVMALAALSADPVNDCFNLGTGQGTSVMEVLATVAAVTGWPVRHETVARRPGDIPILVAKTDKTAQHFGWRPRRSSIQTIVQDTWNWECRAARAGLRP